MRRSASNNLQSEPPAGDAIATNHGEAKPNRSWPKPIAIQQDRDMTDGEAGTVYGHENSCDTTITNTKGGRRPPVPNPITRKLLQYNNTQPPT